MTDVPIGLATALAPTLAVVCTVITNWLTNRHFPGISRGLVVAGTAILAGITTMAALPLVSSKPPQSISSQLYPHLIAATLKGETEEKCRLARLFLELDEIPQTQEASIYSLPLRNDSTDIMFLSELQTVSAEIRKLKDSDLKFKERYVKFVLDAFSEKCPHK